MEHQIVILEQLLQFKTISLNVLNRPFLCYGLFCLNFAWFHCLLYTNLSRGTCNACVHSGPPRRKDNTHFEVFLQNSKIQSFND